jgi:nicotinamidase-related amidase
MDQWIGRGEYELPASLIQVVISGRLRSRRKYNNRLLFSEIQSGPYKGKGLRIKALLVIDMQVGLFEGPSPRYDADGVIQRVNEIARNTRATGGIVVFIQHEDKYSFKQGTKGWEILPTLERKDSDLLVHKQACDSFYETELADVLEKHGVRQLIVTGCATDFCVDTTIRAAASRNYEVMVVKDGHTTKDKPHLNAKSIIDHHNWMWENLILPRNEVKILSASSVIDWLQSESRS